MRAQITVEREAVIKILNAKNRPQSTGLKATQVVESGKEATD